MTTDCYLGYWKECIEDAAYECGLELSSGQLNSMADFIKLAHDNYGFAFYQPSSEDVCGQEISSLKRQLKKERESRFCGRCHGAGRITSDLGPTGRVSNSDCNKCNGRGKIYE